MKKNKDKDIRIKGSVLDNIQLFLLQLPSLLHILIFCYIPMFGIIVAFKNFSPNKGILASPWVGFKNFEFFFTSQDAAMLIRNTILYSLWFLVITTVSAVAIALMLYNLTRRSLVKTYNTIMILPRSMSSVLIAFIVYALLNPASGVMNNFIQKLGGEAVDWYSKPEAWPAILTIVHLWQTVGWSSIIYYAALMGISPELFEAAEIDGATKFQQTMKIAIPEIMSLICIYTILGLGGILSGDFGLHYQITRNVATLYPTTDIINTYVFRALMGGDMAKSAAVGLFQSVVGTIMVVSVNLIVKKISPENSLF